MCREIIPGDIVEAKEGDTTHTGIVLTKYLHYYDAGKKLIYGGIKFLIYTGKTAAPSLRCEESAVRLHSCESKTRSLPVDLGDTVHILDKGTDARELSGLTVYSLYARIQPTHVESIAVQMPEGSSRDPHGINRILGGMYCSVRVMTASGSGAWKFATRTTTAPILCVQRSVPFELSLPYIQREEQLRRLAPYRSAHLSVSQCFTYDFRPNRWDISNAAGRLASITS